MPTKPGFRPNLTHNPNFTRELHLETHTRGCFCRDVRHLPLALETLRPPTRNRDTGVHAEEQQGPQCDCAFATAATTTGGLHSPSEGMVAAGNEGEGECLRVMRRRLPSSESKAVSKGKPGSPMVGCKRECNDDDGGARKHCSDRNETIF